MLVNIHHDSRREHARLLVAGVAFITAMATLIWLSIAIYDKKFERVTMVTIQADRAGLQLPKFGDVRIHGVLVGQVRSVSDDGEQAVIKVAIDPDQARRIPSNVSVQILPTTLFGQKFVSFVTPADASSTPLHDGEVIPASRVETNVELSKILADLFPLLRAVQPTQLNMTLNALATALQGRGEELGQTLAKLDTYLGTLHQQLPTLRQDLISLSHVADTYDVAAPDLIQTLGNLTVTSKTVIDKARQLDVFFSDLTGLSDTSTDLLSANGVNLIRVGQVTAPVLGLLATYSPEFPCLIEGAARYAPRLAQTFGGNQVKQYIEFGTNQYRHYDRRDLPVYGEVGHGPWCSGLPHPPVPIGPINFKDGTDLHSNSNLPTQAQGRLAQRDALTSGTSGTSGGTSTGYAGTPADQQILGALLAGRSGRSAGYYGALGSLLYGPVVRTGGDS